jgi:hypothetical protein
VDRRGNPASGSQPYRARERLPPRQDLDSGGSSDLGAGQVAGGLSSGNELRHGASHSNLVSNRYHRTLGGEYEETVGRRIVSVAGTILKVEAAVPDCRHDAGRDYCSTDDR